MVHHLSLHVFKHSVQACSDIGRHSVRSERSHTKQQLGSPCLLVSRGIMCQQDEELERLHELFASVGQRQRPEPDISAEEWLRQEGFSERMLAVAEACYANDFGCSLHQLGLSEMITENQRWDSGI